MVSAVGVNIQLVFAGAFFVGALLAGLAGVLGGTMVAVRPGNDSAFLLDSLIVVIIGGMGSLGGAAIGSIALGLVSSYSNVYLTFGTTDLTNYSILLTFILVVAMLAVRPLGLFGRPAWASPRRWPAVPGRPPALAPPTRRPSRARRSFSPASPRFSPP